MRAIATLLPFLRAFAFVPVLVAIATARAADIGGWYEQQSRAELPRDECPELIALAARTPPDAEGAARLYYAGGLCYLYSDKLQRDPVAAAAWLARAGKLGHPLARRTLLALQEPTPAAAMHSATFHCHDLGEGRKLCHGGAPR
jgi:TPR repeat protein